MTAFETVLVVGGALVTVGAALCVFRIVRGPSILDRMIASDVLLTTVMIALAMLMVRTGRTDLMPVLLVLAASAAFATIAVARSVSRHDRADDAATRPDPLATVDDADEVLAETRRDLERDDREATS